MKLGASTTNVSSVRLGSLSSPLLEYLVPAAVALGLLLLPLLVIVTEPSWVVFGVLLGLMVTPDPSVRPAGEMLSPAGVIMVAPPPAIRGRAGVIDTPLPILPARMDWVSRRLKLSRFWSSTDFFADVASRCSVFKSSMVTTFGLR